MQHARHFSYRIFRHVFFQFFVFGKWNQSRYDDSNILDLKPGFLILFLGSVIFKRCPSQKILNYYSNFVYPKIPIFKEAEYSESWTKYSLQIRGQNLCCEILSNLSQNYQLLHTISTTTFWWIACRFFKFYANLLTIQIYSTHERYLLQKERSMLTIAFFTFHC